MSAQARLESLLVEIGLSSPVRARANAERILGPIQPLIEAEERERLRRRFTEMALALHWSSDLLDAVLSWLAEPSS